MPLIAIVVIVGCVTWLAIKGRRPNERLAQSRADHPSSPSSSSVHVVHLGDDR